MEATTTSETTYRAVFQFHNNAGASYAPVRETLDSAWDDVDRIMDDDIEGFWTSDRGEWVVQKTTVTTTTTEVTR